ncbi:MAG: hypothetical protein HYT86_02215 [candidate division NC10 bacterium]|nr:hypothetical protein [candidate division NC10 bacterium]
MADWTEHRGPVEAESAPAPARPARTASPPRPARWLTLIDDLANRPLRDLVLFWFWIVVGFGVAYWAAGAVPGHGLKAGDALVGATWEGLATALYFSFVTALSIGYGDVTPVGPMRVLAIVEGAAALLIFGCLISKLVSRHQEELTEEIHRITFEDRLGRVRTNLHLVLSELQAIAAMAAEPGARPDRILPRIESAATVFAGELQAIHDLLYRPQQVPDEQVLESILANLCAGLRELSDVLRRLADAPQQSATLKTNLRAMSALANEICGHCVPRTYTQALTGWMDQIQDLARRLS